jgi:serine/threonine protein kinase
MSGEPSGLVRASPLANRYTLGSRIGSGGMATVYLGRDRNATGSRATVAIKRLLPALAKDPEFVATLVDEGRVVSHIAHPNVVALREVVTQDQELFLVLEYVHGEPLSSLWKGLAAEGKRIPVSIACALARDFLSGLHAAHEAKDASNRPLGIVHRDVSPHNVILGIDGRAHLLDFGLAKAAGRMASTGNGSVKGKLAYMAPEQLRGGLVTRRSDVFAASVVLWELLTGQRLFDAKNEGGIVLERMTKVPSPPSSFVAGLPPDLDTIVMRGLAQEPNDRHVTAEDMAVAIVRAMRLDAPPSIADWVASLALPGLAHRTKLLGRMGGPRPSYIDGAKELRQPSWWRALLGRGKG